MFGTRGQGGRTNFLELTEIFLFLTHQKHPKANSVSDSISIAVPPPVLKVLGCEQPLNWAYVDVLAIV